MAEEEIGKFKISFSTDGTDKVSAGLESIRQGLKRLNEDFNQVKKNASDSANTIRNDFAKAKREAGLDGQQPNQGNQQNNTNKPAEQNKPGDPNKPTPGDEKDRNKRQDNETKKFRFSLLNILRSYNVGGMGTSADQLDKLGAAVFGIREFASKLGPWGIALAGMQAMWAKNREDFAAGRSILDNRAGLYRDSLRNRVDNSNIEDLQREYLLYNRVVGADGKVDAAKSAEAAQASARAATNGVMMDLSLFRTRGRLSPWMNAMLLQNESIDGISSVQDLQSRLRGMKGRISDDQWRTFVSEAGLPTDVINAVVDPASQKIKDGYEGILKSTSYSDHTLKKAFAGQKDIQYGQGDLFFIDAEKAQRNMAKSVRPFEKGAEQVGIRASKWLVDLDRSTTIGAEDYYSDETRNIIKQHQRDNNPSSLYNFSGASQVGSYMQIYDELKQQRSARPSASQSPSNGAGSQPIHIETINITPPEGASPEEFADRFKDKLSELEKSLLEPAKMD